MAQTNEHQPTKTKPQTKYFSLDIPEFDQDSVYGRFRTFQKMCNPFNAFFTKDQITSLLEIIKKQKAIEQQQEERTGSKLVLLSKSEIKAIRKAQTIVATSIHPDTEQVIPWISRWSSFLWCDVGIVMGFLFSKPTLFNTIFWQWTNQTYNAALNYGNRNATSMYTNKDICWSYIIAVFSSIFIALSIRNILQTHTQHFKQNMFKFMWANAFTSISACAVAGYLNAYFMRSTELQKGIDVIDDEGNKYGKSKIAAKKAVGETARSRFFMPVLMFIPPLMLYSVKKMNVMPQRFYQQKALEIACVVLELYVAVPFAIGVYPRKGTIKCDQLEKEFHNLERNGERIVCLRYNKGI